MKKIIQLLRESGTHQEPQLEDNEELMGIIGPNTKKSLFRMWDKYGKAEWETMKYFGIVSDNPDTPFNTVADIIYPLLRIEWEGGVKGTEIYKKSQKWGRIRYVNKGELFEDVITDFKYRLIPVGYDYSIDQQASFGDAGYSCWDILVELQYGGLHEGQVIGGDIFNKKDYPLQSFRNYKNEEYDLVESLWEGDMTYYREWSEYFGSFCQVAIKVS